MDRVLDGAGLPGSGFAGRAFPPSRQSHHHNHAATSLT